MPLAVSILIPAHNAALTLAETLASVLAQTHPHWEAIVVENGSSDATAAVAAEFAARDSRIRTVSSAQKGVSHARNLGLTLARHDWVLFLDADDWILPRHLETLTRVLARNPLLDAVHSGWRRVAPDGQVIGEDTGTDLPDLFPLLSRTCAFAIHTCIVRRQRVLECGGFDPSLRTCEDWDLWQRLARGGARFAHCPEIHAVYRARPQSASMDGRQMIRDALAVIERAFAADPRVPHPLPAYAAGLPRDTWAAARLDNLVWQAGLVLGAGLEAHDLLEPLADDPPATVDPANACDSLMESIRLPTACAPECAWQPLRANGAQLARFLAAVECHARQPGLAAAIGVQLESRAVRSASLPRPFTLGRTHSVTLDLAAPFADLSLPASVERLHCCVVLDAEWLGELELPVCDGCVPAEVIADAAAAEFAWPLLGRFFQRNRYAQLTVARERDGWTIRRGHAVLARNVPGAEPPAGPALHDLVGWPLFVQEAWGLDALPDDAFYALHGVERRPETNRATTDAEWLVVDLTDDLPAQRPVAPHVDLVLSVAGVPTARVPLIVPKRNLTAATIRAALMIEGGFEICRACVREALLQQPLGGDASLRERLRAARARRSASAATPAPVLEPHFMPGAAARAATTFGHLPGFVLWARHPLAPCGTSGSRRMILPQAAWSDLQRIAGRFAGSLLEPPGPNGVPHPVLYTPELVSRPALPRSVAARDRDAAEADGVYDRAYFEALFAAGVDPWGYTSNYEQTKYEHTLQLLPRGRIGRALELACAEGHFTVQLAPHVDQLVATDISTLALERARQRCAAHANIAFQPLDLIGDPLPRAAFDLIVCSEVLYYVGARAELELVAEKLVAALAPGGFLLTTHAHVRTDDPTQPGFDWQTSFGAQTIAAVFARVPELHLAEELRTPLYRVQRFQRRNRWRHRLRTPATHVRAAALPEPLPPEILSQVRWQPEPPPPAGHAHQLTAQFPILMYHRVATDGPAALARYRIAPDQFEAQLGYLRDQGFRSATLEEWRAAADVKRPLPGRRVLLTFDDGCRDFLTTAWPLLQEYGFGALMFLPTDEIGGQCRWDARLGEPAPIMNWTEVRQLRAEGVEFGSHTASHPLLTGLPPAGVAREALRSRAALEEQLGTAVNAIAYPFGASDRVVEQLCGATGYLFGLTCAHRCCEFTDRLLALPRLEVSADLDLDGFAALLTP